MFSPQNNAASANPLQRNQLLAQYMRQCNYQQVGQLNNACFQVFNSFPEMTPYVQVVKVGNTTQNIIELVGNVGVKLNNNTYHVLTHIVFPLQFPTCPPAVRVKNINPDKFCVNSKYLQYYTNDGFITLYLSETQTWNTHQNIIRLLQQMQKELSEAFPFYEKKQNQLQNGMGQANVNSPYNQNQQVRPPSAYQPQPQPGSNPYGQQQGFQNYGNNNSPYGNNYQNPPPNPFGNTNTNNNNNYGSNQGVQGVPYVSGGNQYQQPQQQNNDIQLVTTRLKQELEATLKEIFDENNEEKKSQDQLIVLRQKLDDNDVTLNQMEEDIKAKMTVIQNEIYQLQEFIKQNEQISVTKDNVLNYIKEQNPLQTQILELSAEQESIKETIIHVEDAFKQKKIDFDSLLKNIQYYSELEFNNKVLLKKCVTHSKKV